MKKRMIMSLTIGTMIFSMAACGSSTGATSGKAQADENGNYVVNGGFEESDFTGWTVTNVDDVTEELDIYTRETDCYEGVQSLHFYSADSDVNFTAEQTISGWKQEPISSADLCRATRLGVPIPQLFFMRS